MKTSAPIYDFVSAYAEAETVRFHMPGHKGRGPLGCEKADITEVSGADALYHASGIIQDSEQNAAALFGTAATLYSAEGSSLCIRAMLHLALSFRLPGCSRTILAARNVHHAFISAAALLDFPVAWLWPEEEDALCSCRITPERLRQTLAELPAPPAAVYVTSPDYLGNLAPIRELSEICRSAGTRLLVDQAHGAYLHFLPEPLHAIDQGADLCCDSAHKTLPVLTGGAYLQLAKHTPPALQQAAKRAMLLFGSTSPSYLILQSLDLCNRALAGSYPAQLAETAAVADQVRNALTAAGWELCGTDPLRITVRAPEGLTGYALAELLRNQNAECEYADREYLVLMVSAGNSREELLSIPQLLGTNTRPYAPGTCLRLSRARQAVPIREACLCLAARSLPPRAAVGRICAGNAVACPPCIPICVAGEEITRDAATLMEACGIDSVEVLP